MATIYDVAKRANVSPKTVSRVLNGNAPVGAETRRSVEAAMAELGYVPSNAARMMRAGRSGLIGLVTGALSHKLEPMEPTGLPDLYIVQGIQAVMSQSGKTLMIADTGGASDRVPGLVRTFLQHRVEALIYVADHHKQVDLLSDLPSGVIDCPLLLVNCFDTVGTPAVLPDDARGQYDLVRALVDHGHQRIGYLTLHDSLVATEARLRGYVHAHADAGLSHDPALVHMARSAVHTDDGALLEAGLSALLALPKPPSVICCGNDEMALRVYGLIRSRGLRVPEDVSVAGYDNYRAIAETLYPALTTVELPYAAMGRRAATRALELIERVSNEAPAVETLTGPVFWRSSVTDRTEVTPLRTHTGRMSK